MDTDNPCLQWLPRHKTLVIECKNITHSRRACILHLRQVGGATEASRCDIWPIDLGLLRGVCARVAGCNLLSCRPQRIYVPAPEKKRSMLGDAGGRVQANGCGALRHSVTPSLSASRHLPQH